MLICLLTVKEKPLKVKDVALLHVVVLAPRMLPGTQPVLHKLKVYEWLLAQHSNSPASNLFSFHTLQDDVVAFSQVPVTSTLPSNFS